MKLIGGIQLQDVPQGATFVKDGRLYVKLSGVQLILKPFYKFNTPPNNTAEWKIISVQNQQSKEIIDLPAECLVIWAKESKE